ncbi:MAG: hypothetical protein Q4E51_09680 [Lachnospiraceae bacterium]|nr:hypothetical protein [Lachnospiraceae bacterium]MDO4966960.1 hypothetical protein [Lachnospiraceae bacterium]
MEEKQNIPEQTSMELADEDLAEVSGGRKYAIPGEDTTPSTSVIYDPIPDVPKDLDPSLLHW